MPSTPPTMLATMFSIEPAVGCGGQVRAVAAPCLPPAGGAGAGRTLGWGVGHLLQLLAHQCLRVRGLQDALDLVGEVHGANEGGAVLPEVVAQEAGLEEHAHDHVLDGRADLPELVWNDAAAVEKGDAVEQHLDGQPIGQPACASAPGSACLRGGIHGVRGAPANPKSPAARGYFMKEAAGSGVRRRARRQGRCLGRRTLRRHQEQEADRKHAERDRVADGAFVDPAAASPA